jgi:cysteine desulfurase
MIYLDHNATSPLRPASREAMAMALGVAGNASSVHSAGRKARALVEKARDQLAAGFGLSRDNIVFTSGATEAANTLLSPHWMDGSTPLDFEILFVSSIEHPCVLEGGDFQPDEIRLIPVGSDGLIDLQAFQALLDEHAEQTILVSVMAANNETGVVQPLDELRQLIEDYDAYLVVDAVQMAAHGKIPDDLWQADAVFISSHKLGGPQGAGAILYKTPDIAPLPLLLGGGQEKRRRAGTENVAAIAGFGAAVAMLMQEREQRQMLVQQMRDHLEEQMLDHAQDCVIFAKESARLGNISLFALPGVQAEAALIALDLQDVAVSSGSACSSGKVGQSHVLKAMGVEDHLARGALRISFGWNTTQQDITQFLERWRKVAAQLRRT